MTPLAPDTRQQRLLKRTFIDLQQMSRVVESPLVFTRAQGLYYWDQHGRRYFDAIGGIFVAILGHQHPALIEAAAQQLQKLTFAPPLHGISDVTLNFIETLGSVTPAPLYYVKPFSGGSESIESALKFARQYYKQTGRPGKYKVVSIYNAYHGSTLGAMAASGNSSRKAKFEPLPGGFIKTFSPLHYRDQFATWNEANRFAAQQIDDVILAEDPGTVAAVLLEPISNTGGIVTPNDEFFRLVRQSCDRHDVLLIFDEVITGYARTGGMFAADTFNVVPDIICAGKALASGVMPMGAMIAREEMADAFWGSPDDQVQFMHGNTFAGNPLACAVGMACINEIVQQGLCEKARTMGDYLAARLNELRKYGVVRDIRGKGMLQGVELVADCNTNESFPRERKLGNYLKRAALDNGLIMRIDPDWFAVAPALIATEADINEMCDLIDKSLRQALEWYRSDRS